MDMSRYRELFISEAREHLQRMGTLIVQLEHDPGSREEIASLFRAAHSLKGMASAMGFRRIADLAHHLEDLMDRVRKGLAVDGALTDLLLAGADHLEAMIDDVEKGEPDGRPGDDLVRRIAARLSGDGEPAAQPSGPAVEKEVPREALPERGEVTQTVRVRTGLLDRFVNITGELVTVKHRLLSVAGELGSPRLAEAVGDLAKLLRELHDQVITARLTPFDTVADRFPRVVRDLAKQAGKEVEFTVHGRETELDRGILEGLADPLLHILRNAVDHGMENPQERRAAGKPPVGTISLTVSREKDQMVISVADDGRGMEPGRLIAASVTRGLITAERGSRLTPAEALLLVCQPGFSTVARVTELSGRGVGMDAVRATVQNLNGSLAIESEPGHGSRFILRLPLTIAIINVLLVTAGGLTVAIPVTGIQRTMELKRSQVISQGKRKFFRLDDQELPLLSLGGVFGRPLAPWQGETLPVFVCELRGRRVGMAVDRFVGHQELFVKPFGRPLARLKGVAGGAVLGGGEIVFILDIPNLF